MPEKTKAICKVEAGPGAEMVEVDVRAIGEDEVLIRVKATSISCTEKAKIVIDGLPRRHVMRQHPSGTIAAQDT